MSSGEFSVFQFFPDGGYECVADHVDGKTAVETARSYTRRPAGLIGSIWRVIITDGGDYINFEWRFGEGVVFPTKEELAQAPAVPTLEDVERALDALKK